MTDKTINMSVDFVTKMMKQFEELEDSLAILLARSEDEYVPFVPKCAKSNMQEAVLV